MADSISLSSATRSNLLSLQKTTDLIGQTQERLSTGRKVNSAIDDALSYFTARGLNDRASDLATVKDGLNEGINVIKSALSGLESIESTLKQMKALASSARSAADSTTRGKFASQFNELRSQIDALAEDASYNGINLLKNTTVDFGGSAQSAISSSSAFGSDTMTVKFNEKTGDFRNTMVISGMTASDFSKMLAISANTGSTGSSTTAGWTQSGTNPISAIDYAIDMVDSALSTVRQTATTFGTNSSMLEIRNEFTSNLINTLKGGAGELVNADINEESANMLSLQTRQQLGTISLSIAQQSEQGVLRLF